MRNALQGLLAGRHIAARRMGVRFCEAGSHGGLSARAAWLWPHLHGKATCIDKQRAKFDLPPMSTVPMDEILALIGPEAEEESGS